jgi:hypothetical protein
VNLNASESGMRPRIDDIIKAHGESQTNLMMISSHPSINRVLSELGQAADGS